MREAPLGMVDPSATRLSPQTYGLSFWQHKCLICAEDLSTQVCED